MRFRCALLAITLLSGPGCVFGPRTLEQTHDRYAKSVKKVTEEQLLQTIVNMRYSESPVGLDIASIAAQFEMGGNAGLRSFFSTDANNGIFKAWEAILPDLGVSTSTRPTFSFVPSDDGTDVRRFLTPISLDTLIFLSQSSWPVSTILRLYVERINGVPNGETASGPPRPIAADYERFLRIAELFQQGQDQGLLTVRLLEREAATAISIPKEKMTPSAAMEATKDGYEYRLSAKGTEYDLIRKEKKLALKLNPGAATNPTFLEIASLLNLELGKSEYDIVLSVRGEADPSKFPVEPLREFRVVPRSNAQVYFYLANGIDVPPEHESMGLVLPSASKNCNRMTEGLFHVKYCKGGLKPPPCAYVSIKYRDYWYYIDDNDQVSKQTFALLMQLSRLDFARQHLATPNLALTVGK